MKKLTYLYFLLFVTIGFSQQDSLQNKIKGKVVDFKTNTTIGKVTILNKTKLISTIANEKGEFEILASKNDKILFSHTSYSYTELEVNEKWFSESKTIQLNDKAFEIETIYIAKYKLTGYLEIDTKLIPVNENYRLNIAGLNLGYEPGMKAPRAAQNIIDALSNPVDLVYSLFNTKENEFKKLLDLKKDTNFKELLSNNTNRETLIVLIQLDKNEIERVLEKCNYSKVFINTASDLQVLDALATSYNDYKVLKRK